MRKRNSGVMLWLTDRERQMLNEKSGKAGMSTQRFLRKLISDCPIHEAPPADFYTLIKEMNRIGSNIEQILRVANTKHFIDVPRLRKDLDDLENLEEKLWELFIPGGY